MVSLSNEHIDSDHGYRGSSGGAYGRKRLSDRTKYLYHPAQRSISFVPHVGASRGGELGSDEDRPVVGDVLDHAEPPHAPSGSTVGNACLLFNESGIYLYPHRRQSPSKRYHFGPSRPRVLDSRR